MKNRVEVLTIWSALFLYLIEYRYMQLVLDF